jgi:N-acetylglucosamine-6-sulfatase
MVSSLRRTAVGTALIALVSLAFAAPTHAAQPNIVVVLTDDQRWDTLRYMPAVQRELMGRGVTFTNGFVTNPVCCPSRASILTGAYSHTTGVYQNNGFMGGFPAFRDESTIATWLNHAGYSTGLFGKYLNVYGSRAPYVPPGWDRWVAFRTVGYHTYALTIDGENLPYGTQTYSTDFLAEQAVSFIRASPRPFFVYLAPFAPHRNAEPASRHEAAFPNLARWRPASYNEADLSDKPRWLRTVPALSPDQRSALDTTRLKQIRSLLAVDDAVGQIVQTLSETGDLANTLILFTSDNGLLWGEHRWAARKKVPYEEAIRVPFVMRYDAVGGPVRREQRLALNIDIAPTLAAAAGIAAPGAEGRSLLPLIAGDDSAGWRRRFAVEHLNTMAQTPKPPTYCALRNARYAFMTYRTGERELYDLAVDPYQMRNLAMGAGVDTKIDRLRAQLARLCNPPPPGLSRRLLCTHDGTAGKDSITGSTRYDIVCARGGNDLIRPEGGPDYVYASGGNDLVQAQDGDGDVIVCGSGVDTVVIDSIDAARADCERIKRG